MNEKTKYIPVLITLIAVSITSIITFIGKYPTLDGMITILVVLIIFYILGLIIKFIVEKNFIIEEPDETEEIDEDSEKSDEDFVEEAQDTQEGERPQQ